MKRQTCFLTMLAVTLASSWAAKPSTLSGDYVEVRTCNVYAGTCFVNGEMGLAGKEGILAWSIRHGDWKGVALGGLNVVAVVATEDTLGDQKLHPRDGKAVVFLDARANAEQKEALLDFVRTQGGRLVSELVEIKTGAVKIERDNPSDPVSVTVAAAGLVEISTLGLSGQKPPCGSPEVYYPPLTDVKDARVGFTSYASYQGSSLNRKWEITSVFAAFVGTFAL
ncbi:MAG: DUF1326 domain-containing protein [Verrucomicrobia bacterium]|nr:DUF1326 domain-containing protein [Verrucomicrobiota bacterium]